MAAAPDNSFAAPVSPGARPPAGPVLVTGATGFIGRAFAASLRREGIALRCLVRDPRRALAVGLPASELVHGSLDQPESLGPAVEGARAIVHLAGATRALDAAGFRRANAEGTAALAAAAAGRSPGLRFVQVSSLAAAGPSPDGRGTGAAPSDCRPCSRYGQSKLDGEREVLARADRLDWCVIRPPIVYGPGDDGTRLLVKQALGWVSPVPSVRRPLSLVHVDDLVAALRLALASTGVHGFFPIDGPERSDTNSLVAAIAAAAGRRARCLPIPMFLARGAGHLADLVHRIRGVPGFFCADKLREASAVGWVADPVPARERLGFTARIAIAAGFAATFAAEPELLGSARINPAGG